MDKLTQMSLLYIASRANALVDSGATTSLQKVYEKIETGQIIEWLNESGADMSILLASEIYEEKPAVIRVLQHMAHICDEHERRKMGIENNGFCLLITLVFQALVSDEG